MQDKDLIKQLNNLNKIQPNKKYKKDTRDFLWSEISQTKKQEKYIEHTLIDFSFLPHQLKNLFQPAMAVSMLVFVFLVSGIMGMFLSRNSVPGDLLYISRLISEKAQLAIIFSPEKENTKKIEFANKNAQDIAKLLADPSYQDKDDTKKTKKLKESFKQNINEIKSNINLKKDIAIKSELKKEKIDIAEEEKQFFSADFKKDEQGIQISSQPKINKNVDNLEKEDTQEIASTTVKHTTSTPELVESVELEDLTNKTLEQAEDSFEQKDYLETINKLERVQNLITQDNLEIEVEEKEIKIEKIETEVEVAEEVVIIEEEASTSLEIVE